MVNPQLGYAAKASVDFRERFNTSVLAQTSRFTSRVCDILR
jgi:hypothetical protein